MDYLKNVYAAFSNDLQLRMASSSGAVFSVLAHAILEEKGIIYGVRMAEDCYSAEFCRVTNKEELTQLRGSKYLQAHVGDTFKQVKQDLVDEKKVLFAGTGCQVNGLKLFLQKEYENLFCLDVVCHGTPSPKLWESYVKYREKEYHAKLLEVSFRNKDRHLWDGFEMKEVDSNQNQVYISRHVDPYFSLFVSNVCLRPSCYNCQAKRVKLSDITIADFWGIDDVAPEMNDGMGVSLVITRTDRGQALFDEIRKELIVKEVSYQQGVHNNMSEYRSYDMPKKRDAFFTDFSRMDFKALSSKYLAIPLGTKVKRMIKSALIKILMPSKDSGGAQNEDYDLYLRFEEKK